MPSSFLTQVQVLWKRRSLEKSCRWTPAELRAEQARRSHEIRRFANSRSPFYSRFHKGCENRALEELPILTKTIVMENFDDLVTDRSLRLNDIESFLNRDDGTGLFHGKYLVLTTSGSTGQRGLFIFSAPEWIESLASLTRPMLWAGAKPSPLRRPHWAMIASTMPSHYSARVGRSLTTKFFPTLRLDAGEPVESIVRQLNEWQPEVLAGYPSVLRQLAEEQVAGRLRISPRFFATSAEVLTEETRGRVKDAWGARMFDTYGATEYTPIAAECPAGSKHLFEDGAVIEVVDEWGKPVPPEVQGERVLLTIFGRRTQPLIRYEISDMLRVSAGECACGRPFRLLAEIEGRQEDVLCLPASGSSGGMIPVHPNVFHRVLETVPVSGWQVILEESALTVCLLGLRNPAAPDAIAQSMRESLQALGVQVPAVRVHEVSELRRGKTGKAPLILHATNPAADSAGAR